MTSARSVAWVMAILASALLGACGSPPTTGILAKAEDRLGVDATWYGSDLRIYHAALLYPRGLALRTPGYLLGVENVHPEDEGFLSQIDPSRGFRERHMITHLVRYHLPDGPAGSARPVCVLYTLLDGPGDDPGQRLFERCGEELRPERAGNDTASQAQGNAIFRFRQSLTRQLQGGGFSHILLMVMGWNTDQERALRNFNDLALNMADEAAAEGLSFRPLVIGVTWPSLWQLSEWSVVPTPIVRGLSFPFKRRDANDLGTYVLRDLILHAVLPAREAAPGVPVVLIGHSFGARALATALARRSDDPTFRAADAELLARFAKQDRVIMLQGAFGFDLLFDKGGDGALAMPFAAAAPRLTLSSSVYDSAVSTAFWGQYAGDADTFDAACRENAERWEKLGIDLRQIGCGEAVAAGEHGYGFALCTTERLPTGAIQPARDLAQHPELPARFFDASRLINCKPPFSGGGAHSDVYRRETARFLLREIGVKPPNAVAASPGGADEQDQLRAHLGQDGR